MKSIFIYEKDKNKTKKKHKIPMRYLPKSLNSKDKKTQLDNLKKSRNLYKKGIYYNRPSVKSFTKKKSNHIEKAKKLYNVKNVNANIELSEKTKCSINGLRKIINKGKGAFYSSGSRPNQTAFSWGIARLASAITGGPASKIDYNILVSECDKDSIALKLAKNIKNKI